MNSFIKSLPITSDMVSLWVPSGTSRAIDIIRGNDGQCDGTHPNIPAISGSLDTSLGWHFDGDDDYIEVAHDASLNLASVFTLACWAKIDDVTTQQWMITKRDALAVNSGYFLGVTTDKILAGYYQDGVGWKTLPGLATLSDDTWHLLATTWDGTTLKVYVDDDFDTQLTTGGAVATNAYPLKIGRYKIGAGGYRVNGYMALPFIAKSAWSAAQVNNFYLATKGIFSPRG